MVLAEGSVWMRINVGFRQDNKVYAKRVLIVGVRV
jgi:hypothetical protein